MIDLRDSGEFDRGRGQRAAHHAGLRVELVALERSAVVTSANALLFRQSYLLDAASESKHSTVFAPWGWLVFSSKVKLADSSTC